MSRWPPQAHKNVSNVLSIEGLTASRAGSDKTS